ncbi:ABC transporter permease [Aliarcobacter butzleri]|uniref:ABC transporter permease n=1 Tax=Aliarcobacter butzleri TaxID=28197 RepID=UPI00125F45E0|nr:ABC transporter permease [Aliarcobacter butzleri]MCT7560474.1 ABC transporter permease [Aliarcobacter butzleri]MCT7628479.1 ABC transporter permease [Aliarcobacter butzleri]MCT7639315.1 ABC transporter permease [Aliarcobacter butzleri]UWY60895.1 ABC transporter permease [Aliarcobacter butzleri]
MKNQIKNFFSNNFVYKGKEKLSKLTILSLIILNILVLFILDKGIDFQTRVLNNPMTKFPYDCRDIFTYNLNVDDFNNYIYNTQNYNSKYQNIKGLELDSRCSLIFEKINSIKKNIDIKSLKKKNEELSNKSYELNNQISYLKENYNTLLFEKISNKEVDKSIVEGNLTAQNIKEKYENLSLELEEITKLKDDLFNKFKEENLVNDLSSYINSNKTSVLNDIKKVEKYYSIKYEFVILLFLIPLVLIFFYLMKNYLKKDKYVLYIIYKNILVVTMIPTLISIFSLINIFIPKIFLEKLLMFFYNLEVPFIVYYFAIAIAILLFILIIIRIQKRFKEENEKLKNNKISIYDSYNKNICNICGNKVDYIFMNYCPCCKNQLKIECKVCNKQTISVLDFCMNCGNNIKE